jgi:succinoglycan biosynthesis transport protein ExoP
MDSQTASPPPPAGLQLGDIYYTLFRHKWKILLCSIVGFGLAFATYKLLPAPYLSEARLFIRYVITAEKAIGPGRDDAITKSPDQRGETIISSEVEIITSLDVANQVVKNLGAEKILAKAGGGNDPGKAAMIIRRGLLVEVPPRSSIIRIVLEHPDPEIVQAALRELVSSYRMMHVEIHRAAGIANDFLTQETDQLRARLAQTEDDLRKATNKANIISLEDFKKTTSEQVAHIKQQIFDLQGELAERSSIFNELTKGRTAPGPAQGEAPAAVSPDKLLAYQKIVARLGLLRQHEQELLTQFTEENPRVRDLRAQLAETEEMKTKLETETPALIQMRPAVPATSVSSGSPAEFNPTLESAKINSLQARIKALLAQLEEIKNESSKVDQLEISILELRRQKELQEANYRYYAASTEQARINEALSTGRVSNISEVQTPTPPAKEWQKALKLPGGLAIGGIVLGLVWAFCIELFLDHTVRRPADVERTLRLPLFLSTPKIARDGRQARLALKAAGAEPEAPEKPATPTAGETTSALPALQHSLMPGGSELALNPFYETLRDRLISYFDSINLIHKPKLVAVTGLGKDSGVTTIAAGLARSFSEIGEGNVLLVDMTQGQGSAQHFHKGSPVGLDQLFDTRGSALVQDNLYVVSESSSSERLAKGMPQRFNQLIPKLKASDFDYIIFDMPPVNQISVTPRLASFMDMMLMVVESEKTDRELALNASALLAKSKSPVGVVLNKTKSYVPTRLHQDREFLLGM